MKKQFTLKKMTLLVALLLWGMAANATVTITVSNGTVVVGSNYNTIQAAYNYVKALPSLTEPYIIELQSSYNPTSGVTTETFPITFAANTASVAYDITIKPADGVKVTLAAPNKTVIAKGMTFLTNATSLDVTGKITVGDISMISSASYIAGMGTYASASAFSKVTSVSGNVLTVPGTNCLTSGKTNVNLYFGSANTKTIYFNGAKYVTIDGVSRTGTTGLTIQNPNCIYAQTILLDNNSNYNTIKNCIIRGANQTGAWQNGYQGTVFFATASYNTIANNDVCDMNDANIPYPICAFQMTVTALGTNNNNTVSYNNIYNISNQYSGNGTCTFIQFGSDGNAVNNSVLSNRLYWTAPTTFSSTAITFFGFGTIGLGNRVEDNVIGYGASDGSGKSTLTFTGSGTIYAMNGIKNSTCKNNIIGGIDIVGTSFVGIGLAAHTAGSLTDINDICFGNQIKDISVNCAANGTLYGIFYPSAPASSVNIKDNTIKNLTISSATATVVNTVLGFSANFGSSGAVDINCINNEFSNLTAGKSGSSAANVVTGIVSGGCNRVFEKNLIYNLNTISSGTGSLIKGIRITLSVASTIKMVKNNIIRLGTDVTSDAEISAIFSDGLSSNGHEFDIYHNSIYIGGVSQTKPSHCFSSPTATNYGNINVKNNIFSNTRTGGAVNQILNILSLPVIASSSNNLYQYGSRFATIAPATTPVSYNLMSDWVTAKLPTVVEAGSINQTDPLFTTVSGTSTPDMHISSTSPAILAGADLSATVTNDYANVTRKSRVGDMGAYAVLQAGYLTGSGNWSTLANWDNGLQPTASDNVTIPLSKNVTVDVATATCNNLTNAGKLTINVDQALNVAGNVTIQSDATNGTGTIVDANASGALTIGGTTTVNQNLTSSRRTWYMSSPVAGAQPTVNVDRIKSYNEADNTWPTLYNSGAEAQTSQSYSNAFEMGKGYLVVPSAGGNIAFTGALNAGVKPITLQKTDVAVVPAAVKTGFNLIGNPYPSYLDWKAVYDYTNDAGATYPNRDVLVDGTMWYRTKVKTSIDPAPVTYEYKFWTVTGAGDAGVGSPAEATKDIPPMQAFWVRAKTIGSTSLTLNSTMRAHAPASNKMLKAQAAKNTEMPLVRLQVSNGTNTDEAVIYFSANASNGRDGYDAPKMSNDNTAIPEIYTTLGAEQMVINGMNTIPMDQEIGLGFVAGDASSFSIKANEVSNLPSDVKLILKDNVTKAETDVTDGVSTYEFSPVATTDNRFSVIFRSAGATTGLNKQVNNSLLVYSNVPNQITVLNNNLSKVGAILSVYNAVGQKLLSQQIIGTTTQINGNFTAGVYMVTLNDITKKVVVK